MLGEKQSYKSNSNPKGDIRESWHVMKKEEKDLEGNLQ